MPGPFIPNEYCKTTATTAQAAYALSKVGLFKASYTPTPDTVKADLTANECDFDDYAQQTITAWLAPAAAVGGGWRITAPTSQFLCAAAQVVSNMVGGYWIELAGGAVFLIRQFDTPVPMAVAGDSIQVTPTEVFPNGA